MAVGDKTVGHSSIAAAGFMTIRPASGTGEWVIHNIYHADSVELYITDGVNDVLFDSQTGSGAWLKYAFQLTNGHYLKVKNITASAQYISFDGVVTK